MDNYTAGRMCGKLVKEALPDGGEVMIFVGRLGQLNADQRRQGVIDELLDRSFDPERRDPNAGPIVGDKYTILDTRTDQFDFARAKSQAEDAIAKYFSSWHSGYICIVYYSHKVTSLLWLSFT